MKIINIDNIISDTDDPVDIAIKAFNGTANHRKLWRKYLNEFYALFGGDINKGQDEFMAIIYTAIGEINGDGIPDHRPAKWRWPERDHVHAVHFTKLCRRMLLARREAMKGGAK